MRKLMIGVAAAALVTSGAFANPGKDHGHGTPSDHERGPDKSAKGHGNDDKHQGGPDKPDHKLMPPHDAGRGAHDPDKGPDHEDAMRHVPDAGQGVEQKAADKHRKVVERRVPPAKHERHRVVEREVKRVASRRVDNDDVYRIYTFNQGPVDGCPPGLRKKHNGCLPPGQAKKLYDRRVDWSRPTYYGYRDRNDGRYLYDDGYLLRLNDGGDVLGYLPLLGGALSIGNPWPDYYQPVQVPDYYVDYYNLGPQGGYRYADDVLYRVDPQDSAITSIAALLTGDRFDVGQRMPSGYDVYNVPYAYQDRYYDTPEANYRYADGYVYQVDPTTQLIQAAIELLI